MGYVYENTENIEIIRCSGFYVISKQYIPKNKVYTK